MERARDGGDEQKGGKHDELHGRGVGRRRSLEESGGGETGQPSVFI